MGRSYERRCVRRLRGSRSIFMYYLCIQALILYYTMLYYNLFYYSIRTHFIVIKRNNTTLYLLSTTAGHGTLPHTSTLKPNLALTIQLTPQGWTMKRPCGRRAESLGILCWGWVVANIRLRCVCFLYLCIF